MPAARRWAARPGRLGADSCGGSCGNWHTATLDGNGVLVDCSGDLPLGTPFIELLAPKSREKFLALLTGAGSSCSEFLDTRQECRLEVLAAPIPSGHTLFYRTSLEPDRLQRLDFFYRHFLTGRVGICITDPQGEIIDANPYFLAFYGYHREEVIGQNPRILKSGRQTPDAYREMWLKITDPKCAHWSGEMINRRKNDEEVVVHLTISAVRNGGGSLAGFVASTLDMTAHKQMERDLRASNEELLELNQLKTDLMAITSHDLKSPLNAIISRARMLIELDEELPAEKRQSALTKIVESGEKMTTFINELLDLEKIESGRYQLNSGRLHLDTVLNGCLDTNHPTAAEKGVQLVFRQEGAPRPLRADFLKLEQAFNNVLSNAIRYTPAGGTITVTCQERPGEPRRVLISDTGPGIPDKDLPFIFDRYYQARIKGGIAARVFGAGLGLSIVRKIVELHDGKVWAANGESGGCTFTLEFPCNRKAGSGQDLAALIVDPQQEIYGWLEAPLKKTGISCFIARNLFEARRIVKRECPEMVFVAEGSVPEQLRSYLATLECAVRRISVGTSTGVTEEDFYHQELLIPVIDIELFELIDDVLHYLEVREGA